MKDSDKVPANPVFGNSKKEDKDEAFKNRQPNLEESENEKHSPNTEVPFIGDPEKEMKEIEPTDLLDASPESSDQNSAH